MCENDSNSISESKKNAEHKWKELLYNLFYEIKSETLGKKIEIDEDEYQENIQSITIPKLITYIHDSIQILISKKIEISKNEQKLEDDKYYTEIGSSGYRQMVLEQSEQLKYENIIKKLEEKERNLYKINFHHKLQKEAMENKIEEYMEMEDEFEEMKVKLKYEDGRFLNNDRKDNEILILRSENSKLKNTVEELEKNIKNLENLIEEKNNKIKSLNDEINELKIKVESKQKELNLSQNYFYNITNHNLKKNNNSIKAKFMINHEENGSNDNLNHKMKNYYKLSNGKEKEKDEHNNTVKYYRNQNINLYHGQFNKDKDKPKILSYKKKSEENIGNNDKKNTKGNSNNKNNNKDLLSTTRNEFTERLTHKYFSGNNIGKTKNNNNSLNKKNKGFPMNNNHMGYGKYSYLFNKKNNIANNIHSIKKIISSGSLKSSRPNSTKKNIKKHNGYGYRSSSGD